MFYASLGGLIQKHGPSDGLSPKKSLSQGHRLRPLRRGASEVYAAPIDQGLRGTRYNEREYEDILSGIDVRFATVAYPDSLLCSNVTIYEIRQTPTMNFSYRA